MRQHEGRLLYIDHVNKTTQWTPPSGGSPSRPPSSGGPGGGAPRGRPTSAGGSAAAWVKQSATDLWRGWKAGGGGSSGGAKGGTLLQHLERRSSPPRHGEPVDAESAPAQHWHHQRSGSSSALSAMGGVPHAASAPDMTLSASRPSTAASEAPSSPGQGAPDRVREAGALCPLWRGKHLLLPAVPLPFRLSINLETHLCPKPSLTTPAPAHSHPHHARRTRCAPGPSSSTASPTCGSAWRATRVSAGACVQLRQGERACL